VSPEDVRGGVLSIARSEHEDARARVSETRRAARSR
jgi:hypothetical protein